MTAVIWSPQALLDLQSIRDYIAHDSPRYAGLVIYRLVAAVERLAAFPQSGRMVPERSDEGIREVIVPPYRIVYRLRPGVAEIITVFRASRLFPDVM